MINLSQETIRYLSSSTYVNPSNPEIEANYTGDNCLVSDGINVLFREPSSVSIKDGKIKIIKPDDAFLRRVKQCWTEFKKTDKGERAFCGPVLSVSHYEVDGNNNLSLDLSLITYMDFFMAYQPLFTEAEKRNNYSFGTGFIILTSDDKFLFGVRSKDLSSAGGALECIGGFLELGPLIDGDLSDLIYRSCKEERFWEEAGRTIPCEIKVGDGLQEASNLEIYQEVGINESHVASVEKMAFFSNNLYQGYGLIDFVRLSIGENRVREYFAGKSDKEQDELVFVPKQGIDRFIRENHTDITPLMRDLLREYLIHAKIL